MDDWLERRLEKGDLTDWEVRNLLDRDVSTSLMASAAEYHDRRKKMPRDVRTRNDKDEL